MGTRLGHLIHPRCASVGIGRKNLWNMYTGHLDANVPFTLEESDLDYTSDEEQVETIEPPRTAKKEK